MPMHTLSSSPNLDLLLLFSHWINIFRPCLFSIVVLVSIFALRLVPRLRCALRSFLRSYFSRQRPIGSLASHPSAFGGVYSTALMCCEVFAGITFSRRDAFVFAWKSGDVLFEFCTSSSLFEVCHLRTCRAPVKGTLVASCQATCASA